ncbi:triose-phosphate isomerase [Secundilactobacillus paracollinoides]|uniref:Triosephosphate isomerase n=1 Tax=Secundilactobacillus paracollinoides TaxID=240427 RepID=A0A1B2IZU9_9LACO|nr:triose-phosphate isomerase [Secundilactobacillus paracollinoides]ANZ61610.1 triose-phosphate isomerase [Secundilactobacillus paracollinoides]ANZ63250.1 triose-phosphate isomerase [Secundilactobacillus paracollinoides]ANZ67528.1 triose-phosphate isomerase [Secundilactobacillus paracollinoides]
MRIPLIAGNWKMNKTIDEAKAFMQAVSEQVTDPADVETAIAAPALLLSTMLANNPGQKLRIAAEDCYWEDAGAFTGETSPQALAAMKITYVIVGHSERRAYFNETDDTINRKVHAVYRNQMTPILCCDETMGRLEAGEKIHWVVSQVTGALKGITEEQARQLIIAYEPSWAIGSGKSASAEQAEEGCYLIRQTVADLYSDDVANEMRVLYGGSVNPENIDSIMAKPNIDGVLAGGASLNAETYLQLVHYQK